MPQIIRVKQRAVDPHVIADPVDGSFDVLPPGVHRQQRVTHADRIIQTTTSHAPLWCRVSDCKKHCKKLLDTVSEHGLLLDAGIYSRPLIY